MINQLRKIKRGVNKKKILSFLILLTAGVFFSDSNVLAADVGTKIGAFASGTIAGVISLFLGLIAYVVTSAVGMLITLVVWLIVQVAQYSDIINVPTVVNGWMIVRDMCNMFFVLIFLIVAFATILRYEEYSYKRVLPKLIIMAVLINFSRTIFGLMIDFSQIVMLTFVSAFKNGGGWFIEMFQVNKILQISPTSISAVTDGDAAVRQWDTVLGIIMGMIASMVTLVVLIVLLGFLVVRIVLLWIYTILSPFVFLGWGFPALQKYTNRIWEDFVKLLIAGPLLAFFLWLALTSATQSADTLGSQNVVYGDKKQEICVGVGALFCGENFQKFVIVIGLLVAGLMVTQQVGGAAGSMAGKGMARVQQGRAWASNKINRGIQDRTGISAAKQFMAVRSQVKEGNRNDRIAQQAQGMAAMIGYTKQKMVVQPTDWVKNKWNNRGGNQAKAELALKAARQKELQELHNGGVHYQDNVDNHLKSRSIAFGRRTYTRNALGGWESTHNGVTRTFTNDQMKDRLVKRENIKLNKQITAHDNNAKTQQARQDKFNKRAKIGLYAAGGAVSAMVGAGGGLIGAAAGLAGLGAANTGNIAKTVGPKIRRQDIDTGYQGIMDKIATSNVSTARSNMKDHSNSEVLSTMDDTSKKAIVRMAATMEAMSRGLLSTKKVLEMRSTLQDRLGGTSKADNNYLGDAKGWGDKQLGSQFEALVDRHAKGASRLVDQSKLKDPATGDFTRAAREAQHEMQQNFNNGTYKLSDFSPSDHSDIAQQIADGMKMGSFIKEYKELPSNIQKSIDTAMKSNGTTKALEKLARVRNFTEAYGPGAADTNPAKLAAMKSLTEEDIREILTKGSKEQRDALLEGFDKNKANLPEALQDPKTKNAEDLRDRLL
ncbi:hypothetical protein HGA64_00770 [Candidatus Falkowbacteria bacterium]|nr:hypothetical protein [Candidatus Falkowbacteria bacterium]